MKTKTIFGRKPISLFFSLCLLAACPTAFYYVYQANAQLKPILPPLAAQRNIQQWLEQLPDQLMENEALYHLDLVTDIYRRSDYELLWLNSYELSKAGKSLLQQLQETSADELINYHYHLAYLQQRLYNLPARPKDATAIDILLTDAFVAYAEDVLNEKLLPEKIATLKNHQSSTRRVNLSNGRALGELQFNNHDKHAIITSLITEDTSDRSLEKMMASLQPSHKGYQQLQAALAQFQAIANKGSWREITTTTTLKPGRSHAGVAELRHLLTLYGDYPLPKHSYLLDWFSKKEEAPANSNSEYFDQELAKSVKHFQQRHGLVADGIVANKTRAFLNTPPTYRIKQIALNMKRWRQLPEHLGERYIWVNLTDYHLDVMDGGRSIMDMKVIVGKKTRPTPSMYEKINSLVLNPQWNVPRRIMIRDILPKLKNDPTYLSDRNIRIINGWQEQLEVPLDQIDLNAAPLSRFPYRLQQDAGEDNALGVVKFVIPNDDSIYLHDTNNRNLFSEHERALSSGCVRVEKPLQLASLLLDGKRGWNRQKIDEVLAKGKTTYVKLPEAIPTYLSYWTAWVDEHNIIQFRDDIYHEDSLLKQNKNELESLIL